MWGALKQLNSKPVVVLKKLKCIEDELKKPYTKCMTSETAQHGRKGSSTPCIKRKASLEDAFNDANAAFFKSTKKLKKDKAVVKDRSTIKPQKSKTGDSEVKGKWFKSSENTAEAGRAENDTYDEKNKKFREKHQETTSVIDENSMSKSDPPRSEAPNAILSYLELAPKSVVSEESNELPECFDEGPYPSGLSRSDSVETIALELDHPDETAELAGSTESAKVDCVDLISPVTSPKKQIINSQGDFDANGQMDIPHSTVINSLTEVEKLPPQEVAATTTTSRLEKDPKSTSTGAKSSTNVPNNMPVASQSTPACNNDAVRPSGDLLSKKSLTTIPECSSQLQKSPNPVCGVSDLPEINSLLETKLRSSQPHQTSIGECNATTSTICKSVGTGGTHESTSVDSSLEKRASRDTAGPATLDALPTPSDPGVEKPPRPTGEVAPSRLPETRVWDSNTVAAAFDSALKSTGGYQEIADQNSHRILIERKKDVISGINEARQSFSVLTEEAKPHDHSLRMKILQFDSIKKELEDMRKRKELIATQVKDLMSQSELLKKKHGKLLQENIVTQQAKLETEFQLREQQMELCKEQLLIGTDRKLDETHPKFHTMQERQAKVDKLSCDVMEKNAAAKMVEESLTHSNMLLKNIQKQLEDFKNQQTDNVRSFETVTKKFDELKSEIKVKAAEGYQRFSKQKDIWLKCMDLRDELLKIEALEKLYEARNRRKQVLSHNYHIYDQLNARSFFSSQDGTTTSNITTAVGELLSGALTERMREPVANQTESPLTIASNCVPLSNITLNQLAEVVPYYANFLDDSFPVPVQVSKIASTDEGILCRNIILGCHQYWMWKACRSRLFEMSSPDEKTMKQCSAYVKEFVIPLFQLWSMKNLDVLSILSLIVDEGLKNNWYGFRLPDLSTIRNMLESSVCDAIGIGKRFAIRPSSAVPVPTARVEYAVTSSDVSLVPAAANHSQTDGAAVVPESSGSRLRLRNMFAEPCAVDQNSSAQETSGAFLQATQSVQTQASIQVPLTTVPGMNVIESTAQQENQITSAHIWSNTQVNNGVVAFQSTVVQKTAVVLPVPNGQYSNPSGHCIPAATNSSSASQQFVAQGAPSPQYHINQVSQNPTTYSQPSFQNQVTQNPTSYSQSSFQAVKPTRFPGYVIRHPTGNYSFVLRAIAPAQNHQDVNAGVVRGQCPTGVQNMEVMQHQGIAAQMPVIQQQVEQMHHPNSVQPSHQMQQQQLLVVQSSTVNAQNKQHVTRPPMHTQHVVAQQTSQAQPSYPHQSNVRRTAYSCLSCRKDAYQKCSGCQQAYYCSSSCQWAHWEVHRSSCSRK